MLVVAFNKDKALVGVFSVIVKLFEDSLTALVLTALLQAARTRFSPEERDCYFQEELPLLFLPAKFYRYEMSNCLFEAAYEEVETIVQTDIRPLPGACWQVLQQCNCTPSFHALGYKERPVFCLGLQLLCMNNIMKSIGKYNKVGNTD